MDDCIEFLGDAQIIAILDANFGYWKVPVDDKRNSSTTFTTHEALFRFTWFPFGLMNAPAKFQKAIYIVLSSVKWNSTLFYLDDMIIFSRSIREHFDHVTLVLKFLQYTRVTLKLKKCFFFQPSVDFLGNVVLQGKLHVTKATTKNTREV